MQAVVERDTARDQTALEISPRDQALLTPAVIERWTQGLAPDEIDLAEVARLERGRLRTLETIRQGVDLSDLEFKLVRYLQKHERRTMTYQQIAHHLWGSPTNPITARVLRADYGYASPYIRHIWVLVSQIRQKLEIDPIRPQHLATIRGVGYRWYNAPPSLNDGEDYGQRAVESEELRAQVRTDLGYSPIDPQIAEPSGKLVLGPAHPDYAGGVVDGDVTQRSSRARP